MPELVTLAEPEVVLVEDDVLLAVPVDDDEEEAERVASAVLDEVAEDVELAVDDRDEELLAELE